MRSSFGTCLAYLLVSSIALSGCKTWERRGNSLVSAEPLKIDTSRRPASGNAQKKEYLGELVRESYENCSAFIGDMTRNQGDANTIGDISTTTFTALATIAKPLTVIHGLTAAATITSGSKNAFLSGYYAKASIANIETAIIGSYYKAMRDYADGLQKYDREDSYVVSIEEGKITTIHSMCSLAAAEATILATLNTSGNATNSIEVAIAFSPTAVAKGQKSTMTLSLQNASGKPATLNEELIDQLTWTVKGFAIPVGTKLGGTCDGPTIGNDQKSIHVAKGKTVATGGCTITLDLTPNDTGEVTSTVAAQGYKTDQGNNLTESTSTLAVTAAGAAAPTPPPKSTKPKSAAVPGQALQNYNKTQ